MPDKTIKVKAVAPKGKDVSLMDTEDTWYKQFDSDLEGKIYPGGEIKIRYVEKGQWKNIEQYKIISEGNKSRELSKSQDGGGSWKGSRRTPADTAQIQKNTESKQRSIVRQVALKEASTFVTAVKGTKATIDVILEVADKFDEWLAETLPVPAGGKAVKGEEKKKEIVKDVEATKGDADFDAPVTKAEEPDPFSGEEDTPF